MRELGLNARTRHVLNRIRTHKFPLSVYGRSHARVMPMVRSSVNRTIVRAGVGRQETNAYKRAVEEMVAAFRGLTLAPLADALAIIIRKWVNFGLRPGLVQTLFLQVYDKFDATGHLVPKAKGPAFPPKPGPKPVRKRRCTYEQALRSGRGSRRTGEDIAEQAKNFTRAVKTNKEISNRVAGLLAARGVPGQQFIRYNAFAQKLGRLARRYSLRSLERAAADLIDLYEAKSLDPDTLRSIAELIFGLNRP